MVAQRMIPVRREGIAMPAGYLLIKIIESHDTAIPMPGRGHAESSLRPFMGCNSSQRGELIL